MGEWTANPFEPVISHPLPGRLAKPRTTGQTMVIDKGLGLVQTEDLLNLAAGYIDFIKLAFGTAALYPPDLLRTKVELIRSYGVDVYPGGTFLEAAIHRGQLDRFLDWARNIGFTHIEVSDGTLSLPSSRRREAVRKARDTGFGVLTEVGKKDGQTVPEPEEALAQIHADLDAGAAKVILEGRESGRGAGIYDRDGNLQEGWLEGLLAGLPDPSVLMWEAPLRSQQALLISRFGPNVNLGNIPPADALGVEALRCGLRGDTFRLALRQVESLAEGRVSL